MMPCPAPAGFSVTEPQAPAIIFFIPQQITGPSTGHAPVAGFLTPPSFVQSCCGSALSQALYVSCCPIPGDARHFPPELVPTSLNCTVGTAGVGGGASFSCPSANSSPPNAPSSSCNAASS